MTPVPFTKKNEQKVLLKDFVDKWVETFESMYPTKTIGHHHYIRRRHLQRFLYDYTKDALSNIKNNIVDLT